MIRINQLKLPVKADVRLLKPEAAKLLRIRENQISTLTVLRRSIDARKKPDIFFSYSVRIETTLSEKEERKLILRLKNRNIQETTHVIYHYPLLNASIAGQPKEAYFQKEENRPIVVGFGPAGMFAALVLANLGMRPIVYERGASVEERAADVRDLWERGSLHTDSNAQFGEGGAGTFSDGKLNTVTKDTDGRNQFILNKFVALGADPSILIDAKPHVGTDCLMDIVRGIREEITALGGEIHFHTTYHYQGEKNVILAIGHSARDTYEEFYKKGLTMQAKDFAMGFRVQHPQSLINHDLYGDIDRETLRILGPGAYKVTHTSHSGRGVYSFCMCPGGYVVNSSSEEGRLCVNGMSYHARDGRNANAAIIVTIRKTDYQGEKDPLGGIRLQQELEKRAFDLANGKIPIERYGDFKQDILKQNSSKDTVMQSENDHMDAAIENESTAQRSGFDASKARRAEVGQDCIEPAMRGAYAFRDLSQIFRFSPDSPYVSLNDFNESFIEGMESFEHMLHGFSRYDTILAGVEARTSSPVRIPRDENFRANLPGIYPCGEGAGYAGGIMSAAMDGMKTAEALVRHYNSL
ncbi:MAG: dehydrogenase [Oribacterium sp.]|nr:dehydrogenase [Oribacterium sp.]